MSRLPSVLSREQSAGQEACGLGGEGCIACNLLAPPVASVACGWRRGETLSSPVRYDTSLQRARDGLRSIEFPLHCRAVLQKLRFRYERLWAERVTPAEVPRQQQLNTEAGSLLFSCLPVPRASLVGL
jgi:hypothetical protein